MKFLGFTTILLIAVIVLLMVSVGMDAYTMWTISSAPKYVLVPGTANAATTVTTEGVEAQAFWKKNKLWMIGPTVANVLGMALLGLMLVMS